MFGNILERLLGKTASTAGRDVLDNVAAKYGNQITQNAAAQYGDDAAKSILSSITTPAGNATPEATQSALSEATKAFNNNTQKFGNLSIGTRVQRAAKSNAEDAYVKRFGNALSKDTLRKMRTTSPRYSNKTYAQILEENGVSPANIDLYANTAKTLGDIRDEAVAQSDALGNRARGNEVLGIFQNRYNNTNFGKTTFKNAAKDYAKNYLGDLSKKLDDKGNLTLQDVRVASSRLQSKAADLKSLAAKGGANGEENGVMAEYLNGIGKDLDDYIDNAANNDVKGASLQNKVVQALSDAGVHPNTIKEVSALNPEEFNLSTAKSVMAPYVFAGSDMAKDIAAARPTGGQQIWGIPGTEPVGNAMANASNEISYRVNKAIANHEPQKVGATLKKGAKYGALGLGGLAVLSNLTGGGNNQVNPATLNSLTAGSTGTTPTSTNGVGGVSTDNSGDATFAGYSRSQLESAYMAALMDNNGDAADVIGNMLSELDNDQDRIDASKKTTSTSNTTNPADAVATLQQAWQNAGGAQGVVGGNITNLLNGVTGGAYNPNAATYEDLANTLALTLAKLAGNTGAPSDTDRATARQMLPSVTDSASKATAKWYAINQLLSAQGQQ